MKLTLRASIDGRAMRVGKLAQPIKGMLPQELRGMLWLLPDRLPASQPFPEVYPAEGKRRARVALLIGCVQNVLAPEINWATLRVLAENGVEVVIPRGQGCCGALMLHTGDSHHAQELGAGTCVLSPGMSMRSSRMRQAVDQA